jgi:RND family efflux transporter MFP subunit
MKITFNTVVLAAGVLVHYGCNGTPERSPAASATPIPVKTIEVRPSQMPLNYDAVGTIRARTTTAISSKVMGYVREIRVQAGDRVTAGQLLVAIDARDLEAAHRQAQAGQQEVSGALVEAENGVAAATAQLTLAKSTFGRMEDLYKKKSISDHEFDQAVAALSAAEANHRMAVSKQSQVQSRITQATESVAAAEIMTKYAEIRAPFTGVVVDRKVEAGTLATPGTPLLQIEQASGYRIEAQFDESMLGKVRPRQSVQASIEATGQNVTAIVDEIVPSVDPTSRAFTIKASLPPGVKVQSGMFARLRVPKSQREAIVVPVAATMQTGDLHSVFVNENGIVRRRMITAGGIVDGQIEVLSGLSTGERVIHPRPSGLTDGARIEVHQ